MKNKINDSFEKNKSHNNEDTNDNLEIQELNDDLMESVAGGKLKKNVKDYKGNYVVRVFDENGNLIGEIPY